MVIRFGTLVFAGPMADLLQRTRDHVDIAAEHAADTERLRAVLVAGGWSVARIDAGLRVVAEASQAAALNRAAADAGITLARLVFVQDSLEQIFLEMTGNKNRIAWHHTRQHDHLLDRITSYILRNADHDERDFAAAPANDERVINGPGVNVPCISLNRYPYDEYHTTDDNLDIMDEDMLTVAAQTAEDIIRVYASNYIPKRTFRGPVFLSGHGLWVDWRDNWALNRAIEKIMMRFEGRHTIFDIAEQVGLDYQTVRDYVEKFRAKGFVTPLPIPSEAETG